MDWDVSDRDRVRGRYLYSRFSGIDTERSLFAGVFCNGSETTPIWSLSPNTIHFPPRLKTNSAPLIAETTTSDLLADFSFPDLDWFLRLCYFDDIGRPPTWTQPGAIRYGQVQDELQLSDSITGLLDRHTLKSGYDFRDMILSSFVCLIPERLLLVTYISERYLSDLSPDSLAIVFLAPTVL